MVRYWANTFSTAVTSAFVSLRLSVHPGREWFTVLSGTARLQLGERTILVQAGGAAESSTMTPHVIGAHDGPVEILTILDHDGERAHLHAPDDALPD